MSGGRHAPFQLWALIVAWVFQLLFLVAVLGLYIIVELALSWSETSTNVTNAVVGVEIALAATSIILIVTEIILCGSLILSPLFYLISNVIKSIIWVGLTIATLVINHGYRGDTWSGIAYNGVGIGISASLMLLFLIPTAYAAVLYHQDRRASNRALRSAYANAQNPTTNPIYGGLTPAVGPLDSPYYTGATVPRPDFIDLEDGQEGHGGHGFVKKPRSGSRRAVQQERRREVMGSNGRAPPGNNDMAQIQQQTQSLMRNEIYA